jgi:hypothetical protein
MTFASPIISTGRIIYDEWPVHSAEEPHSQPMALSFFAWIRGRNFQWLAFLDQDTYMTSLPKTDSLENLLSSKSLCSISEFNLVNFGGNEFISPKYPPITFLKRSHPLAMDHDDLSTGAARIGVFSMSRGNAIVRGTSWIHTTPLAFGNQRDVEPVVVNGNFQTPIISHFIVPTEAACVGRNFADPRCSAMNSRIRSFFSPSALQQRMIGLLKSFHRLDSYTPWSILSKTLSHSTFSFHVSVPLDTLIVLSRVHSSHGINSPSTRTSDVPRALDST